ncbi:hypothetical protein GCM10009641_86520 [Mycobacterium cookii]|uniref:Uncharacterized protein n=1 Tax=Nocardioides furvisabuli TaxID=375542 RepID=A0ABN2WVA2_9ACTN|nr:hypothetical protein [Nocardioides furvisabuli]
MSSTTGPTTAAAARRRRSPWLGPQGLAAALVLVVTAGWRGVLLEGSYFNQDDYYLTSRALAQTTWSWSYLMEPVAGHVMPLQHATHWLVGHHLPFDWQSVAFLILLLQLTCGIIAWHLLSHLLPDRWARVPLLALLMWAPLTLATTLWWSASMSLWPHLLSALVAALALVRERLGRGRSWINIPLCLAACFFGLAWHERSVLIAPLLVGLALALSPADGWRRIPEALRRFWVLWAAYAVGMVAYLWLHVEITTVSAGTGSARKYVELSIAYVFENALPGLVGGPWMAEVRGGAVVPPVWVSVLSGLLVLAVAVALLRRGGADARWALLLLLVYLALDLALVLAGRVGFGRILGYDPRYASDLLLPAVLAVALALRNRGPGADGTSAPAGRSVLRRAGGAAPALAVTGLVLVASSFGTAVLVPHFQNPLDREYWSNVRADLARDPSQVIVDELVPPEILLPLLGEEALASSVFAPLPETPVFDQPAPQLRTLSGTGRLEPVTLLLPQPMKPGPDPGCGYAVSDEPRKVRLQAAIAGRFVARISYFTDTPTDMSVTVGDHEARFRAFDGPNDVWVVVPDQLVSRTFTFEQVGPPDGSGDAGGEDPVGTVCIAGLVAGVAEGS